MPDEGTSARPPTLEGGGEEGSLAEWHIAVTPPDVDATHTKVIKAQCLPLGDLGTRGTSPVVNATNTNVIMAVSQPLGDIGTRGS